jgi:hypothetical protein
MSHTAATQQPAVVLRTDYKRLRTLLAIAILLIAGLTTAVVALATSSDRTTLLTAPASHEPVASGPSASSNEASRLATALDWWHTHELSAPNAPGNYAADLALSAGQVRVPTH